MKINDSKIYFGIKMTGRKHPFVSFSTVTDISHSPSAQQPTNVYKFNKYPHITGNHVCSLKRSLTQLCTMILVPSFFFTSPFSPFFFAHCLPLIFVSFFFYFLFISIFLFNTFPFPLYAFNSFILC